MFPNCKKCPEETQGQWTPIPLLSIYLLEMSRWQSGANACWLSPATCDPRGSQLLTGFIWRKELVSDAPNKSFLNTYVLWKCHTPLSGSSFERKNISTAISNINKAGLYLTSFSRFNLWAEIFAVQKAPSCFGFAELAPGFQLEIFLCKVQQIL